MNLTSIAGIKSCLQQYNLHPKKMLGQNFLYDRNVLHKILATAELSTEDTVVEIGPGLGVMTQELLAQAQRVGVIEFDFGLQMLWEEQKQKNEHLFCLFQDVLEVDIEAWLQAQTGWSPTEGFKVCANIPYNITTPIVFQLLTACPHLVSATLMMQKEVAQRMVALPGTKAYGRLTLTVGYYAQVESLLTVSRRCFYPQPEVDSVVVRLTPHREKPVVVNSEAKLMELIQAAFSQRRKMILNPMSNFWQIEKSAMAEVLISLGIDPHARAENLSLQAFAQVVNNFIPQ